MLVLETFGLGGRRDGGSYGRKVRLELKARDVLFKV